MLDSSDFLSCRFLCLFIMKTVASDITIQFTTHPLCLVHKHIKERSILRCAHFENPAQITYRFESRMGASFTL